MSGPGEKLQMKVAVSILSHLRLTALWLGINTDTYGWGGGPNGQPTDMHPILAHVDQQLLPGEHRFVLRWLVPGARSSGSFFLVSAWSSHHSP